MKKTYETPEVEVVMFQYRDQVVVASAYCEVSKVAGQEGQCIDNVTYSKNAMN